MGIGINGTSGGELLNAVADGDDQIHIYAEQGDDVIRLGFANQITPGKHEEVNGHHAFGDIGDDQFRFEDIDNVTNSGIRMVGRIEDFNYSRDKTFVDGEEVDLKDPPSNVRIVQYQAQQWILINDNILYALEGARLESGSATGEEKHFIEWPSAWLNGVPSSADVNYIDPVNFVPDEAGIGGTVPIVYTGAQTFGGSNGAEHIFSDKSSGETSQIIRGRGGDDIIDANQGDDTVYGGSGNDRIAGGLDKDLLLGGSGDDTLWGGTENDTLKGQAGDDVLHGGHGDDALSGANGNDSLYGDAGNDKLFGRNNNDVLRGGNGDDRVHGDAGDDLLYGDAGHDSIRGGDDDDVLRGGSGNDTLYGDQGDDVLKGDNGNDDLRGGTR